MIFFVIRFFLILVFLWAFGRQEFKLAKERSLKIQGWKAFLHLSSRWAVGKATPFSALVFASFSFLGFALWESLILSTLGIYSWRDYFLFVGVIVIALLMKKRSIYHEWSQKEVLEGFLGLGLLLGILFCWVLIPWLFFRSRYLNIKQQSI